MNPSLPKSLMASMAALLVAASLAGVAPHARAGDLESAWKNAQSRDPGFRAAGMEQQAGTKRRDQAAALWNPQVMLDVFGGGKGMASSTEGARFSQAQMGSFNDATFKTSTYLGLSGRAAISAVMPIFDKERQAQADQLGLSGDIADTMQAMARLHLAQSVTERYLDALNAREMLRLTQAHEEAIAQADNELKKRRSLGDVSAIDVRESAERLELVKSQRISAQTDLQLALSMLADLSASMELPQRLRFAQPTFTSIAAEPLANLTKQLKERHPQLQMLGLQRKIALAQAESFGSGKDSAKVSAIAQVGIDHTNGRGEYGNGSLQQSYQLIGVQLQMPLSTGGLRSAKQEESLLLANKWLAESDRAALELEQALRAAWHGVASAQARLPVLERVLTSSRARLADTRKAHATGARTTLELLAAQTAAIDAERALFTEGTAIARHAARILALTAQLDDEGIAVVNRYLH